MRTSSCQGQPAPVYPFGEQHRQHRLDARYPAHAFQIFSRPASFISGVHGQWSEPIISTLACQHILPECLHRLTAAQRWPALCRRADALQVVDAQRKIMRASLTSNARPTAFRLLDGGKALRESGVHNM